jgi:SpoVK/Ycf46/Vps4 family AAA+-type ATPase
MAISETTQSGVPESVEAPSDIREILTALNRLDRLLEQAVVSAQKAYGADSITDRFRGLHIGAGEIERLLTHAPGAPVLWAERDSRGADSKPAPHSRLAWVTETFGLSAFDIDVILLGLAPEIDLRYERLYAFLQDDVSKKRPTVDLALNLLCPSAEAKLAGRVHFSSESPLIRHRLIRLSPDAHQSQPPLLAHSVRLDEQIVRLLLHQPGIDARLEPFCRLVDPVGNLRAPALDSGVQDALRGLVWRARETRDPLRLYFHGPAGLGKQRCAEALASEAGVPLLIAYPGRVSGTDADFREVIELVFREAWFQDAMLCLDGLDGFRDDARSAALDCLLDTVAEDSGITIMTGTIPWHSSRHRRLDLTTVPFSLPDFTSRRAEWLTELAARGVSADEETLNALSDRFRLTPAQISDAVSTACSYERWRSAADEESATMQPTAGDLFAAARAQSGHELDALAHKIEPRYTWDDIVLPEESMAQLREICRRVAHRQRVFGDWGFDRKLSLGKGTNALFAGSSGTGKTMATEIIAHELGLDLYRINLAGVVSKYIGETEKNLDRIFSVAGNANAILFFDEADALFGKRSEVRDSHDRYANLEISYLLQKMEAFDGISILATNLRQNLDDAFMRRLAFIVQFPFPDESSRKRIWTGIWPAATPRAADVDLDYLARQFKLSGGNIKNIALASAFLAAEGGTRVTMAHLAQATRREYQKMGKTLSDADLVALNEGRPVPSSGHL